MPSHNTVLQPTYFEQQTFTKHIPLSTSSFLNIFIIYNLLLPLQPQGKSYSIKVTYTKIGVKFGVGLALFFENISRSLNVKRTY